LNLCDRKATTRFWRNLLMGSFIICRAHIVANIIRMLNPRRMRMPGHVTGMKEVRNAYKILVGNLEGNKNQRMYLNCS
jgi:hypothetical protein